MIFTKTLLDSVSAHGPSEAVSLAGVGVRLHLTVAAVGGNGATVAVETSFDGSNWTQVFSATAGADATADQDGSTAGSAMKFVRLNFLTGGTSTVTATLTAFE